jgi:hypothetical protein
VEVRGHPLPRGGDDGAERIDRPGHGVVALQVRQDGALGGVGRGVSGALGQGGRGAADGQPEADLQGEDRRLDAVDRPVEVAPEGDGAEQGGDTAAGRLLVAASVPVAVEAEMVGHEARIVGLEVVEGPFDDDPSEFAQ